MDNKALENIMTDYVTSTVKSVASFNTEVFQLWMSMSTRMLEALPATNWLAGNKPTKN